MYSSSISDKSLSWPDIFERRSCDVRALSMYDNSTLARNETWNSVGRNCRVGLKARKASGREVERRLRRDALIAT